MSGQEWQGRGTRNVGNGRSGLSRFPTRGIEGYDPRTAGAQRRAARAAQPRREQPQQGPSTRQPTPPSPDQAESPARRDASIATVGVRRYDTKALQDTIRARKEERPKTARRRSKSPPPSTTQKRSKSPSPRQRRSTSTQRKNSRRESLAAQPAVTLQSPSPVTLTPLQRALQAAAATSESATTTTYTAPEDQLRPDLREKLDAYRATVTQIDQAVEQIIDLLYTREISIEGQWHPYVSQYRQALLEGRRLGAKDSDLINDFTNIVRDDIMDITEAEKRRLTEYGIKVPDPTLIHVALQSQTWRDWVKRNILDA